MRRNEAYTTMLESLVLGLLAEREKTGNKEDIRAADFRGIAPATYDPSNVQNLIEHTRAEHALRPIDDIRKH